MLVATILALFHVLGFLSSINALLTTRTSQGAIAWIVALNSFPLLAVPVYWVLGRNKFNGYVTARHAQEEGHDSKMEQIKSKLEPFRPNFYATVFSISTNILRQHSIKTNPTWFLSKQNAFY
jgi:cardiolipin synthase